MNRNKIGRYSKYIRHISFLTDLIIISLLAFILFRDFNLNIVYFILYLNFGWFIIAIFLETYEIFRFTKMIEIISKNNKHAFLFLLIVISFFPFTNQNAFDIKYVLSYVGICLILISISKGLLYFFLEKYRLIIENNLRRVLILGYTPESIELRELFEEKKEYGYHFLGYFSDKERNSEIMGGIEDMKIFVKNNMVDEIYCSLSEISNIELKDLIDFADEHYKKIKFIPDSKQIYSKNLKIDHYEFFPILSLRESLLFDSRVKFIKRVFDIFFSLIIIITILSWLVPILSLLIKLESRGPVFFKQGRPGINEGEFSCFKFRSMKINKTTEIETSKDDPRVTYIGKFMRKTSIDEIPQFFNVLIGDMSVVGPRPHLWSQNKSYGTKIKKYTNRHNVKPGITGLAQVSGYRGAIEKDADMINRIRLDLFYIENWSFMLDIRIIFQTIINVVKGDEKAY